MHRTYLLVVTAISEAGTGLLLLVWPPLPILLLLGVERASPEALCAARIAGAALIAISVACWQGRNDPARPVQSDLLLGVLIYDLSAAGVLALTGWFSGLVGIALWPAVVLHAALSAWCVASFGKRHGKLDH
jgi:hypothetical protein